MSKHILDSVTKNLFHYLECKIRNTCEHTPMQRMGTPNFAFIPLPIHGFLNSLDGAIQIKKHLIAQAYKKNPSLRGRPTPVRFLDAGCGVGTKLIAAYQLLYREFPEHVIHSEGLENDPHYVKIAQDVFGQKVVEQDILTFTRYHEYDIIYFYNPLRDETLEKKFEKYVTEQAAFNTIIIACLCYRELSQPNIHWIHDNIYLKTNKKIQATFFRNLLRKYHNEYNQHPHWDPIALGA